MLALHLAFPLTDWWWIAPFALAGLFASWCIVEPWPAVLVGFVSGLVFFTWGFSWFGQTAGTLLGPFAWVLSVGPAILVGFAFPLAAVLTSLAARRCDARAVPLVAAAAFALAEELRSVGVMGNPFSQLGVAEIDSPLRALAAYGGGYAITFATALLGASLGWWLLATRDRTRALTALTAWAAVALLALGAWAAWPARHHAPPTRRVAAVQGGISQSLKMSANGVALAVDRYTALTRTLRGAHVTLVLWPETVIPTDLLDAPGLRSQFAQLANQVGAPLWVGAWGDDREQWPDDQPRSWTNALYLFRPGVPGGVPSAMYAKAHLVPFAEYLPGPRWLRALPFADQIGHFAPGVNARTTFDGATPLICWESLFGDIAHARLADDPSLLMIATDDAWFGDTQGPYEHAQAATLRAVETGRWVLRAGATGISGIIAPDGTWTRRTTLGTSAVVVGEVGAPAPGPYARIGPAPVGIALAALIALPFWRRRR
ncbi:MAG TPA: apolipoprotein N-acyltransferase [Candidatus Sulfotelmatobacter sp.]|nr:apolipoprotein N-acyltransferase [Candidatus Sulfotelmatobacter sp.]